MADSPRRPLLFITAGAAALVMAATAAPLLTGAASADTVTATVITVPAGDIWKYNDNGVDLNTAWRAKGYDDKSWKSGAAELGFGDGDERTIVSYGSNAAAKHRTTYFRKTVTIDRVNEVTAATLRLRRDDGAVVYVNGAEIVRQNLPTGTIGYTTYATDASDDGKTWRPVTIPLAALDEGANTIAVEVHQSSKTSSDLSFDAELSLTRTTTPPITPTSTPTPTSTLAPIPATPWKAFTTSNPYKEVSAVAYAADGQRVWIHEDYRATRHGAVYLLEQDGTIKSWLRFGNDLPTGYANRPLGTVDTEAMAIHNGYMYIADNGDAYAAWNTLGKRPFYTITRFPVPNLNTLTPGENLIPAHTVEQVHFTYGTPSWMWRNSEAFVVDPRTGDMILFEKTGSTTTKGRVWRVPAQWGNTTPVVAPEVGQFPLTVKTVSDATISKDGATLWLRNGTTLFTFPLSGTDTLLTRLTREPATATALPSQPQGEGLTIDPTQRFLLTQSEGAGQPYWGVPRP